MSLGRSIASLLIAFHLAVIVVIPNASSHWQGQFAAILFPYTNFFGLHNKWAFFSPDPSAALSVEYELRREGKTIQRGEFPESQPSYWHRGFYNRRISTVRFVEQYPAIKEDVYRRLFCPLNLEADTVVVSSKTYKINGFEEIDHGKSLNSMGEYVISDVKNILCVR